MKKPIFIIIAVMVGLSLCCIGVGAFTFMNLYDPTANANTIEDKTREFITALHEEEWDRAYALTATIFQEVTPREPFEQMMSQQPALANYQRFEMCEWSMFDSNGQTLLQGSGLLYFEGGEGRIIYTSTIVKESEEWKIAGFQLLAEQEPVPFGRCAD